MGEQLGDALVANGKITAEQRDWAMQARERAGTNLTVILISSGLVPRLELFRVLAELTHVPFIDLIETPPEPGMLTGLTRAQLIREGWVPLRELDDGRVLVAIARVPRPPLVASIERTLGRTAVLNTTTDWDIRRRCSPECASRSSTRRRSACGGGRPTGRPASPCTRRQRVGLVVALIVLGVCAWLWPSGTLQTVTITIAFSFLAGISSSSSSAWRARGGNGTRRSADEDVAALVTRTCRSTPCSRRCSARPTWSANWSPTWRGSITRSAKLEVLLLLEEDDEETISAAKAAGLPPWMTLVTVPRGQPQTKPKACNVGLFLAKGDYLVIYDAEDRPDPDQLKKAIVAFRARRRADGLRAGRAQLLERL